MGGVRLKILQNEMKKWSNTAPLGEPLESHWRVHYGTYLDKFFKKDIFKWLLNQLFNLFLFFGCAWYVGQGSNPSHSSDSSHISNNTGSLATRPSGNSLKYQHFFFFFFYSHTYGIWKFWTRSWSGAAAVAYATAEAIPDLSHICDLHRILLQWESLNPLSEARDWTCILTETRSGP